MKNTPQNRQAVINEIEAVKKHLTDVQKALEDNNLQDAGDTCASVRIMIGTQMRSISDMFNSKAS